MSTGDPVKRVLSLTVEAAVRLGVLALLLVACAQIVLPFVIPALWGAILAIVLWPAVSGLTRLLGGRQRLAASLVAFFALVALLVPSWLFARSVTHAVAGVGTELAEGRAHVPAPPEGLADWPLVGKKLADVWSDARENPPAALEAMRPQLARLGEFLLAKAAGLASGVLLFALSIVLAGVLLATAQGGARIVQALAGRFTDVERGKHLVNTAVLTVRGTVKGVLGVAAIQALAGTVAMFVARVPAAAAWGLLVLVLAVVQLTPLLVLVPVSVWVFSTHGTVAGVLFLAWSILVGVSDSFLKPLLLGRGGGVPTMVILVGAIGGLLAWGVLGLFVGAVVLAVGWELARAWLEDPEFALRPGAGQE